MECKRCRGCLRKLDSITQSQGDCSVYARYFCTHYYIVYDIEGDLGGYINKTCECGCKKSHLISLDGDKEHVYRICKSCERISDVEKDVVMRMGAEPVKYRSCERCKAVKVVNRVCCRLVVTLASKCLSCGIIDNNGLYPQWEDPWQCACGVLHVMSGAKNEKIVSFKHNNISILVRKCPCGLLCGNDEALLIQYGVPKHLCNGQVTCIPSIVPIETPVVSTAIEPVRSSEKPNTCIICMERTINTTLLECGHICMCLQCSEGINNCPICRQKINRVIKSFIV